MTAGLIALMVLGTQASASRVQVGYTDSAKTFAAWKKQYSAKNCRLESVPLERGKFWLGYERDGVVTSVEVIRELGGGKNDPPSWWACCSFNKATSGPLAAKLSKDKEFLVIYVKGSDKVILTFTVF